MLRSELASPKECNWVEGDMVLGGDTCLRGNGNKRKTERIWGKQLSEPKTYTSLDEFPFLKTRENYHTDPESRKVPYFIDCIFSTFLYL